MKFLVTGVAKYPLPSEAIDDITEGMKDWVSRYTASGTFEGMLWAMVEAPSGGGIINADNLDELDDIMLESPVTPFSDFRVHLIVPLEPSLERCRQAAVAMAHTVQMVQGN